MAQTTRPENEATEGSQAFGPEDEENKSSVRRVRKSGFATGFYGSGGQVESLYDDAIECEIELEAPDRAAEAAGEGRRDAAWSALADFFEGALERVREAVEATHALRREPQSAPGWHRLKTHPTPFEAVWEARKNFEVRDTKDRDFVEGDMVTLLKYDPATGFVEGSEITAIILYVLEGGQRGLPVGLCVFGLHVLRRSRGDGDVA